MSHFQALVAAADAAGHYQLQLQERAIADLPAGDVLIRVHYSSLNYKDALSATGHPGITRHYPHTPGIDAAGIVVASDWPAIKPGDGVIVTGFDLGMNTAGGFGQYIRVPHAWVIPCPAGLSLHESMAYGTAGFTAALCIHKLHHQDLAPEQGSVLVTGATGGVGSIAIALLAQLGYAVVAVTGKTEAHDYLRALGATEILSRAQMDDNSGKPLLKGQYAGAVDTVGGTILATILKQLQYGASVSVCGLVQSPDLHTTVYPFILRGVNLLGVDSAQCDRALRLEIWRRLATEWKCDRLSYCTPSLSLSAVPDAIQSMLSGQLIGHHVIHLDPAEI